MTYYCLDFRGHFVATSQDPECLEYVCPGLFEVFTTKEEALDVLIQCFPPYIDPKWLGVECYEDEIQCLASMIYELTKLD